MKVTLIGDTRLQPMIRRSLESSSLVRHVWIDYAGGGLYLVAIQKHDRGCQLIGVVTADDIRDAIIRFLGGDQVCGDPREWNFLKNSAWKDLWNKMCSDYKTWFGVLSLRRSG